MKLHISSDEAKGTLFMDFIFDFKNTDELENLQDRISKGNAINSNKNEDAVVSPTDIRFSFDGKKFERRVIDKNISEKDKKAYKKSMEQTSSYMEGSTYNLEYHFPKPVKSTTYKDAKFSADRKTLYIESSFKTISENPKNLSFTVILE